MCDKPATSHEHAPPKSLFPETRDLGRDCRKELITVPSCDVHNSSKSHDDEFLMVSLAGIIGNNSIGYQHKLTKVDRALRRTANRLLDKVIIKRKSVKIVEVSENKFLEVIWGTPDIERLNLCFNHIARALYYHHFGHRFYGDVKTHLGFLFHYDANAKTLAEFIKDRSAIDLANKPLMGSNPDVFYYQVTDFDEFGLFMMRLCFYGGVHIYIAFIHAESNPTYRLEQHLQNLGVRTIYTLGEKTYEFNAAE
jgi:hypothetical protein